MQYVINGPGNRDVVTDIDFHQPETVFALQMGNVLRGPGHEVVQADHLDVTGQQAFREMRADESSPAR